jgi:hypothetical protein
MKQKRVLCSKHHADVILFPKPDNCYVCALAKENADLKRKVELLRDVVCVVDIGERDEPCWPLLRKTIKKARAAGALEG